MSAVTKIELFQKYDQIVAILSSYKLEISAIYGYGWICNQHYGASADMNLYIDDDVPQELLMKLKEEFCHIFNKKIEIETAKSLTAKTQILYGINFKLLPETIDKIRQTKINLKQLLEEGKNQYELAELLRDKIKTANFPKDLDNIAIEQLSSSQRKILVNLGKIYGEIAEHEHAGNHLLAYLNQDEELREIIVYAKRWNIHYATVYNKIEIIKSILELEQAQVNSQETKFGNTALHIATMKKNETLINLLFEYGTKDDIKNNKGITANQIANEKGINLSKLYQNSRFFSTSPQIHRNNNDVHNLEGELLESFDEVVLGEFEMLADIKDEKTKAMLIDILYDSNIEVSEVVKYVNEIDPVFGNRFGIVYCCMNPSKWDDELMQGYKRVLLESYIKLSLNDTEQNDETLIQNKELWLKNHAKNLLSNFLHERNIQKINLPDEYQVQKKVILTAIHNTNLTTESISEDASTLKKEINEINQLIKEDAETTDIHKKASVIMKRSFSDSEKYIKKEVRLSATDSRWPEIYELINKTPTGVNRSSEKMLKIVNAVLYKTFNNCRWRELPQYLPHETTVRHYYYQWKSSDILGLIMSIIVKDPNKSVGTFTNLKPSM